MKTNLPIRKIAFATLLLMAYAFVGIQQLAAASDRGLLPSRLRCEALVNPLAVDVVPTGLSWIDTSAERGQKQTAWQVLVASSPDRLVEGKADLWDSGKQAGEAMQVPYGGRAHASKFIFLPIIFWTDFSLLRK